MGCLTIKAEVDPGSLVSEACEEAQQLCEQIGIAVEFKFNDVICHALPGGNASKLTRDFWTAAESKRPYKFAFSK